jgi:SAM-dependent methyltransferase
MPTGDMHGLGYERVDDDPDVAILLDTMEATAQWDATLRLRAWERSFLGLTAGQRLLDVGCGVGDAAIALGAALGDDGEIVGIDVSAAMIASAVVRARSARCPTRFAIGDAMAIAEPDASFDVVRSERTLQWLPDPELAVAEMVRVLRPGGRLALIDTDWSTFDVNVGDDDLRQRVRNAMRTERRRPSNIGRRLTNLVGDAGLELVAHTSATQQWRTWDPDLAPVPEGCFSMSSLADDVVEAGQLPTDDHERFVSTIHEAARHGRFSMALTMFAAVAVKPSRS